MRSLLFVVTAMAVIGLVFWAYHENYETQQTLSETAKVQRKIGDARGRLAILRAEWAYLNRPDRLRELASINFDRLGLMPLSPDQFGRIDQVAYPNAQDVQINNPVEVSADVSVVETSE